jgi:hypothetical protein
MLIGACKTTSTEPFESIPAGRRDYIWTVDTLNKYSIYNDYHYLYGTSPENIWCVGQGDYSDRFLRFDGTKWSFLQGTGRFEPWSVYGISENDIWFGGDESSIWHYANGKIDKVGSYPLEGYGESMYNSFWGNSPNDIYAVGCIYTPLHDKIYGIIMHYNGLKWEYVVKPETEIDYTSIKRGIKDGPNYFINGYKIRSDSPDSLGLFEYDGKSFKRIYFDEFSLFNSPGMLTLDGHIYFGFRERLYKYINNHFVLFKDFSGNNIMHMGKISGRSEKDLFVDLNGGIGHYNGTDIKQIYSYENTVQIYETLHLEKDSYFLCYNRINKLFLFIHGRLK